MAINEIVLEDFTVLGFPKTFSEQSLWKSHLIAKVATETKTIQNAPS